MVSCIPEVAVSLFMAWAKMRRYAGHAVTILRNRWLIFPRLMVGRASQLGIRHAGAMLAVPNPDSLLWTRSIQTRG